MERKATYLTGAFHASLDRDLSTAQLPGHDPARGYRGEIERFDPVAGHIPGAVSLFYGENLTQNGTFKPKEELRAMYARLLGDVPPERLVVHCGSGVTACHTLLALEIAEMPGASLYVGSWSEWCRSGRPQAKG